jgi:hypothetical protein
MTVLEAHCNFRLSEKSVLLLTTSTDKKIIFPGIRTNLSEDYIR